MFAPKTQSSRLVIAFSIKVDTQESELEWYNIRSELIADSYMPVRTRIREMPDNRIDDFPGSNRFLLSDAFVEGSEGDWHCVYEIKGEGDWLTPAVGRDIRDIIKTVLSGIPHVLNVELKRANAHRTATVEFEETLNIWN